MNKDQFIRLWANRSNLSLKDARICWLEVEKIFDECVEKREELHLKNIGHLLYSTHSVPAQHIDITTGEVIPAQKKEVETVYFRLSRNLKDLMIEDPTKRKLYLTRQAELRRSENDNENDLEDYEEGGEESEEDE